MPKRPVRRRPTVRRLSGLLAIGSMAGTALVLLSATAASAALPPATKSTTLVAQTASARQVPLIGLTSGASTWSIVSAPSHGSLDDCTDGTCAYTSDPGFAGEDSFTWTATSASGVSAPATLRLMVRPDAAPFVDDDHWLVPAGSASKEILPISDGSDPVQASIQTPPAHGALTCNGRQCTYTPDDGYLGSDSFTWQASDGQLTSRTATTEITVQEDQRPALFDKALMVRAGGRVVFSHDATDPERTFPLTFHLVKPPTHGSLVGCADGVDCTYQADAGYVGPDSFTWTASDGVAVSRVATVYLTVHPNLAPVARGLVTNTWSGQQSQALELGTDFDGDPLTYQVVTPPQHGTATCVDDHCDYTSDADFSGQDGYTYRAFDGQAWSNTASVSYAVSGPRVPSAKNTSASVVSGHPSRVPVGVSYGFPSSGQAIQVTAGPTHGTLTGCSTNQCAYQSDAGYSGSDSFTWQASDVNGQSQTATATLIVRPVAAPTATAAGHVEPAGQSSPLTVTAADPNGNDLRYVVVTQPEHGHVDYCYKTCIYTPDPGFTGTDSFSWKVSDGEAESAAVTDSLTVQDNVAPTMTGGSAQVPADHPTFVGFPKGTDPEGRLVRGRVDTPPSHGALADCSSGGCTYVPEPGYAGTDSFTFVGDDGVLTSDPVTFDITVKPNTGPVVADDVVRYPEDFSYSQWFPLKVTDDQPDNELFVHVVQQPKHGQILFCVVDACAYQPDPGFAGVDTFTYRVTDGLLLSATATQTVVVPAEADLAVSLTRSRMQADTGSQVVWRATAKNLGDKAATRTKLVLTVPSTMRIDRSALPGGCRLADHQVICTLGSVAGHAGATVSLRTAVTRAGSATLAVSASSPSDPHRRNNATDVAVRVTGRDCTVVGTFGADRLWGTSRSDVVCGLPGADALHGRAGDDVLKGGSGDDTMIGGAGVDRFVGGPGRDRVLDGPH